MAREPIVGSDNNAWGSVLNSFLSVSLNSDGTLNSNAVSQATPQFLQYVTGGGVLNLAMITAAKAAGYQGIFLDPRFVWDASGLVLNNITNFTIESRMVGSIGWLGAITYNSQGYITTSTGSPTDGIQIYASSPSSGKTQGVIFKNCVIVGNNSRAVVHFGGGERRCGLVDTLVYNTNSTAGAYAVVNGSALSDNNSENNIFSFTGGGGLAGAYAALGIGVADQTQRANDTWYYGLATSGGSYSIVKTGGGNHTFLEYYDRSSPTTATVWNHGGGRMTFIGGEDQNGTGLSHLIDNASSQTILINRMVTQFSGATTTCQVSAGTLLMRGSCTFNVAQTVALSGSGVLDLSDPAVTAGSATVSGSSGTLMLASNYAGAGSPPILTSWTGILSYQWPAVIASLRGTGLNTTQTLTWTPPAIGGIRFRVSLYLSVFTAGTSTVPVLSYHGIGSTTPSYTIPMWLLNSAATVPSYTCNATGEYYGSIMADTDGTGSAVTLTVTPTGSSFRMSAVIERLT